MPVLLCSGAVFYRNSGGMRSPKYSVDPAVCLWEAALSASV